jgi:manganese efflux pump family protein
MDYLSIFALAVGLAMDAFAVCIAAGIIIDRPDFGHYFRLSFHFGLFQFLMPIAGYFAGNGIEQYISSFDHWIALALLSFIGIKMIRESFSDGEERMAEDPSRGSALIMLSVATSIDALAVGFSMGILARPILIPSIIIGVVCAAFSLLGIFLGKRVGKKLGRRVERLGGLILIGIGIKIFIEHIL